MSDQALKTTPLNAAHRALGARMVGFGGYDMPVQYEGVLAEHRWTREHAGLFDVSHMGQARITGADAIQQFQRFVPGDYEILKAGKQKYSLLLNAEGGIMDDLMAGKPDHDGLYVVVNAGNKDADFAHLAANLSGDAKLTLLEDRALLAIAITLAFFHLGNAAMLPLLGQSAVARFDVNPAAYTGVTVIIAQVTMIATALLGSWIALRRGYGMLFLIALLALPVRGLVAGFYDSPWSVVPVQILDGISSGLMGVATPAIVARILRGSGHVNLGLGFVLTIQGLGAAFSTSYGGLFAHYISYSAAFLALAVAPCVGLTVFALASRRYRSLADAATAFN